MSVRIIEHNEVQALATIPPTRESFINTLNQWLSEGTTKLAWCHAFEYEQQMVGRMVYSAYDKELEVSSVLMNEPDRHAFSDNLMASKALMSGQGFDQITYHLYDNRPQFDAYFTAFKQAGYAVTQCKKSFVYNASEQSAEAPKRLSFKALTQVSEDDFALVFEAVTVGTLDRDDQDCVIAFGSREAAARYINQLKEIDFTEDWWRLAYDGETCVGLVVAQRFSESEGAINYLGVLPEHRGKGYSEDLILEALRLMAAGGIEEIIADIDEDNHPLDRLLTALNFEMNSSMYVLKASI